MLSGSLFTMAWRVLKLRVVVTATRLGRGELKINKGWSCNMDVCRGVNTPCIKSRNVLNFTQN
jgi:hypothetical protein